MFGTCKASIRQYEARAAEEDRQPYRLAFSDYFKGNDLLAGTLQDPD